MELDSIHSKEGNARTNQSGGAKIDNSISLMVPTEVANKPQGINHHLKQNGKTIPTWSQLLKFGQVRVSPRSKNGVPTETLPQKVTSDINEKGKAIVNAVELVTKEYFDDPECNYNDQGQAQSELREQTTLQDTQDTQVTSIVINDSHHIVSNPEPVLASIRFGNLEIEGGQLVVELNAQSDNSEGKPKEPKPPPKR
ncbi:unnamed protein product [Ilex paraguariensis]|uniref:Uncharacterized protein n=1 Tax=Ilex paraguariensis TaxID=185542 RepID=A0ABC8UP01_9AQUA